MTTDSVSAAKLAVYIVLLQPALFCLWRHGKTGFLGWFYVQLFCLLRIVTGAVGLHGSKTAVSTVILNSIGLSPLLLSISGILHEARRGVNPQLNKKLDIILEIKYHGLVALGMILTIIAVTNLMGDNIHLNTDKTLLNVGSGLSCIAWIFIVLWAAWSWSMAQQAIQNVDLPTMKHGKTLMKGVFVAIPFVVIRLGYGIAFLQLRVHHPDSSFLTSKEVQVWLNLIPEMFCISSLLLAGVLTQTMRSELKRRESEAVRTARDPESERKYVYNSL